MARSTFGVFLMHDSSSTATPAWEKLVDIKSFPDLGGDPENIEITTPYDITVAEAIINIKSKIIPKHTVF